MRWRQSFVRMLFAGFLLAPATTSASAVTVYSYVGAPFNVVTDSPSVPGAYNPGRGAITVDFRTAVPLAPNLVNEFISPASLLSFHMDDAFFLTDFLLVMAVSTDASGQIVNWSIQSTSPAFPVVLPGQTLAWDFETTNIPGRVVDRAMKTCPGCNFDSFDSGARENTPQQWRSSTEIAPIPLPPAVALFATGLVG